MVKGCCSENCILTRDSNLQQREDDKGKAQSKIFTGGSVSTSYFNTRKHSSLSSKNKAYVRTHAE